MHDDDLHPDHELASAYLDGDVTEVQRAQVEASPELSALVATMRDVRSQLADVPPASVAAREAALAAMLAEFDAPSTGADEPATPAAAAVAVQPAAASNVVSLASRRRWPTRIMSAAAGLLVVGAVGVAVKGGLDGSSDSKASSATFAPSADRNGAGGNAPEVAGPPATIGSIMGAAGVAVEINDPQALLAYADEQWALTSTKVASAPDGTSVTDAGGTAGMSADTFVPTVEVVTGTLPPEISNCASIDISSTYLGVITYQGTLAYVVRDPDTAVISAVTEACFVVATATP